MIASDNGHAPIVPFGSPIVVSIDLNMPTINYFIGKNRHVYNNAKHYWSEIWKRALHGDPGHVVMAKPKIKPTIKKDEISFDCAREGELEGVFDRIIVEGRVVYPAHNRGPHDQGNARSFIEKVIGDVLESTGHIRRDDWDSFSFGDLQRSIIPGLERTELMIFPVSAHELDGYASPATFDAPEVDREPINARVTIG